MSRPERGSVPARVLSDNRVAYYPSGTAGVGDRKFHRAASREEAERVASFYNRLAAGDYGDPLATHFDAPLFAAMAAYLKYLADAGAPGGTTGQYASNFNTWVPKRIAIARCGDLDLMHFKALLNHLVTGGASVGTLNAVKRTIGSLVSWGLDAGWFTGQPFGSEHLRRLAVKKARRRMISRDGEQAKGISIDLCPTPAHILDYAEEFEHEYPGYGRRLVLVSFHSGARIMEAAGFRNGDLDAADLLLHVDRQLDRTQAWPAIKLPKNAKRRNADLWAIGLSNAASLDAEAADRPGRYHGWWFPPLGGEKGWADRLSHMATRAARACGWDDEGWTHHWTRHAYATYSLAPTPQGFGMHLHQVQRSLGHAKPTTTQEIYVHVLERDVDHLRDSTASYPQGPRAGHNRR